MLTKLILKNIALIEYTEIDFSSGLNVLSGETGAGKSVILDSLNFVLGAKADKTMIRHGTEDCFVQAVFSLSENHSVREILTEYDIETDEQLIFSRKFDINGKGYIKINGMTVTANMLKEVSSKLVDVHGQSEHFYLLKEVNQLICLDKFCNGLNIIKEKLNLLIGEYRATLSKINGFELSDDERERKADILKFQIDEIERDNISEGEEEELLAIRKKIQSAEKIISSLSLAGNYLKSENGGIDLLNLASSELEKINDIDKEYSEVFTKLEEHRLEIEDISDSIASLLEAFDYDEEEANRVEVRLDAIKILKKKYGSTIAEINSFLEKSKQEYDALTNFKELSEKYSKQINSLESEIYIKCQELSKKRKDGAKLFSDNVKTELKELGMKNADFFIDFATFDLSDIKRANENGLDSVSFMFSANLGEPPKTLSKVISGGEMSRFMLALKTQILKFNDITTFIFDEIDTGISGVIARTVAEKFAKIALKTQIIAISHLPQIAAMSDNQLLIIKTEYRDKTVTNVKKLDNNEKIYEIIRLLGGSNESQAAKQHASDMINSSSAYKNNLQQCI